MSVWFICGGRSFDIALGSALGASYVAGNDFSSQFLDYIITCAAEPVPLVLVLDIYNHQCIGRLLTCMRRSRASRSDLSKLTVILLSTFDTWGGDWPKHSIVDIDAYFHSRLPLASAYELYHLENELASVAARNRVRLRIVGCGLLYGGDGLDFKDLFMSIWRKDERLQSGDSRECILPCRKDAVVPVVAIANFLSLMKRLVSDEEVDGPVFVPAVDMPVMEDGAVLPCAEVLRRFSAIVDGSTDLATVPDLRCDCAALGDASAWNLHVPFAAGHVTGNLLTDAQSVWAEFLKSNSLQPISILLAGPPRVGKSDLARVLAERLEVEAVTLESAVRFLFRTRHEVGLPPSVAQALAETYSELRAAVDAKAAEGKKPSKGSQAAAAAEEALIDEAVFTPAFCQTLPADLLRRCVSAQVNLQPSCRRRGFVLDVWDGKVVTGLETAQEALNFFSLLPGGKAGEGIELVVELHCPATLPTERLVATQGAQAKSKEAQGAVKALEAQLSAYSATLRALPSADEAAAGVPAHMASGSAGVLDILQSASESRRRCLVCRIDCAAAQFNSPAGAATAVTTAILGMHKGRIGWLSPSTQNTSAVETGTVVSEVVVACDTVASSPCVESWYTGSTGQQPHGREIVEQISGLDAEKRSALVTRSSKLESFLTANVLPQVAAGLVQIQREQPDDPVLFLAEHLLQHSAGATAKAQEAARQRFLELLHLGGF